MPQNVSPDSEALRSVEFIPINIGATLRASESIPLPLL